MSERRLDHRVETSSVAGRILAIVSSGALSLALLGCPDSGNGGGEGSSTAPAPVDESALKAEYEAAAEQNITEENAEDVLEQLEKELEADTE